MQYNSVGKKKRKGSPYLQCQTLDMAQPSIEAMLIYICPKQKGRTKKKKGKSKHRIALPKRKVTKYRQMHKGDY
jgi:hypothetical protein